VGHIFAGVQYEGTGAMTDPELQQLRIKTFVAAHGSVFPFGVAGPFQGKCSYCGEETLVSYAPCRTAYADPASNESPVLCEVCTQEYNDYWDDMWSNVPGHGGY